MNTAAEIALDHFVSDFDEFVVECAKVENTGVWDSVEYGPMSAYFETDLFSVVLQAMSADGVFSRPEAEVVNRMFSSSYTPREFNNMYRGLKPVIDDYCDAEAADAVALLSRIDPALCERYRKLILDACEVMAMSDGSEKGAEQRLINRLRTALRG